jgi:hypothetical protein
VAATERELIAAMTALRRATKISPQKSQLTFVYLSMVATGAVPPCPSLRALLVKKSSKSQSGVLVRLRAFMPKTLRGGCTPRGRTLTALRPSFSGHHGADVAVPGGGRQGAEIQLRVELLLLPRGAGAAALVPARRARGAARQPERLRPRAAVHRPVRGCAGAHKSAQRARDTRGGRIMHC